MISLATIGESAKTANRFLLSFGILFNLDDAKELARDLVTSAAGYIMGGVLPIIFGSLALVQHHVFTAGWSLVVSVIGLFMVLIGAFRVLFVKQWRRLVSAHVDSIPVLFSLFGLMLGLLLLYTGFISSLV